MSKTATANSWWQERGLLLAGGAVLLTTGIAVWAQLSPSRHSLLFWICWGTAAIGTALVMFALLLKAGRALLALRRVAVSLLLLAVLLLTVEATCRLSVVDFDKLGQGGHIDPRAEYPLSFREPDEAFGDVYFKRAGPLDWKGKPLSTILKLREGTDDAYLDEPEVTLHYDSDGFRNPPGLKDWDVVVVGDSFTETGYLPQDKIFTSVAAAQSGTTIKNLGLCNTGPFTYIEYLKQFGAAPSGKVAVLAFMEGNDIGEAAQEAADLQRFRATGIRDYRTIGPQTSFLKALYQMAKSRVHFSQKQSYRNATFTAAGKEVPITLYLPPLPPDPDTMPPDQKRLITQFLTQWRESAEKLKMKPWLLYLPVNDRIYYGLWRAEPNLPAEAKNWKPTSLPELIRDACADQGIHFVDPSGALRAAAEHGTLVYNPIFDTHLNEEGSRLVGEVLAKALKDSGMSAKPQ